MTIRVAFAGYRGKMGVALLPGLEAASDIEVVARLTSRDDLSRVLEMERPDVLIDFTTPACARLQVETALQCGVHPVSGTTGFSEGDLDRLRTLAEERRIGALIAPNFSIGALLMMRLAVEAAPHFEGVEVLEAHHATKRDAPSGTAKRTAEMIGRARGECGPSSGEAAARGQRIAGVPVHSLRLPGCVAHQEIVFGTTGQTLSIRHDVMDRSAYLPGLLLGVRRVGGLPGMVIGLESLLFSEPAC